MPHYGRCRVRGTQRDRGSDPAVVLTNTGQVADGSLSGLSPVLRLVRPDERGLVGPDAQFDVPLSSILQITLDFPRIIIETATRTLIGPFSAIRGLPELLLFDPQGSGDNAYELATASLRAIALHGGSVRPVPREWMGNQFLTKPQVLATSPLTEVPCENCSIAAPSDTGEDNGDRPIWNTMTPTIPPDEGQAELPWWVGLLGVAVVIGILYFLTASGGTS
mgnify:CR=1 FL=1